MSGSPTEPFALIAADLEVAFGEGVAAPWPEARFNALALRVFRHQFAHGETYRRFCISRGVTPETVDHWTAVPSVPTSAFKYLDFATGSTEASFVTSGTTRGRDRRGRHGVRSLALYRAACLPGVAAHLVPEGGAIRILTLVPTGRDAPTSSLSVMLDFAIEALGAEGSRSFVHPAEGLDVAAFAEALSAAEGDGVPVWLAGTAFAFVHWLDAVDERRASPVCLPPGSRLMETGGFKGLSREVEKRSLYARMTEVFGIPDPWIVNEYGMTELLSQFYDGVVGDETRPDPPERIHRPPPWMRSRVVDPVTLAALPEGTTGILAHMDLANLGSVSAILTEDQGVAVEGGGFHLGRRLPGAEPRGCSRALDELLQA